MLVILAEIKLLVLFAYSVLNHLLFWGTSFDAPPAKTDPGTVDFVLRRPDVDRFDPFATLLRPDFIPIPVVLSEGLCHIEEASVIPHG